MILCKEVLPLCKEISPLCKEISLLQSAETSEIFGISLTAVSDHILARPKIWKKRSTLVSEFFEIPTRAVVALFGVLRED